MQVLFLALGASRKKAVVEESARVVAAGGRAVVLAGRRQSWADQTFADGVELVASEELQARHLPHRAEQLVFYRVPRAVARRLRGTRLKKRADRALKSYEKKVAGRVHRRIFEPLHQRVWPKASARIVRRLFAPRTGPELVVVADPLSMEYAAELLDAWEADGAGTPRVAYGVDMDVPQTTSAAR